MFDQSVSSSRCQSTETAGSAADTGDDDFDRVACPHIDRNDSRCGHRFTLGRLDQAFSVCMGGYHGCPIYQRITNELQHPDIEITIPRPALTKLTLNARLPVTSSNRAELVGQTPQSGGISLRRTGT